MGVTWLSSPSRMLMADPINGPLRHKTPTATQHLTGWGSAYLGLCDLGEEQVWAEVKHLELSLGNTYKGQVSTLDINLPSSPAVGTVQFSRGRSTKNPQIITSYFYFKTEARGRVRHRGESYLYGS